MFNDELTETPALDSCEIDSSDEMSCEMYASIFQKMMNGFALHKIITDESGKPIDYKFIVVNNQFEKMVGLKKEDLICKKVTEALPGTEKDPANWIGRYGKVALDGEELRFENYSSVLNKWFHILAYSPKKNYFVTIIEDITERKEIEKSLQEKIKELQETNTLMINRELRMVALKEELDKLSGDIKTQK